MGRKKIFVRLPKLASINCLHCGKKSRRKVPFDSSPQYFDCDKCGQRTKTPMTQCCVICAFTEKKCAPTLRMKAMANGLSIKL